MNPIINPSEHDKHARSYQPIHPLPSSYNYQPITSTNTHPPYFPNQFSSNSQNTPTSYEPVRYSVPTSHPFNPDYHNNRPIPLSPQGKISEGLSLTNLAFTPNYPSTQSSIPHTPAKSTKNSKGLHLAELEIDEFPEKALQPSPYMSPNKYSSYSTMNKEGPKAAQQPLVSLTGSPYFTSIRASPFNKAKGKINFFEPQIVAANVRRDETIQQGYYNNPMENLNKYGNANIMPGMNVPRTPKNSLVKIKEGLMMRTPQEKTKDVFMDLKILRHLVQYLNCTDILRFRTIYYEYRNENEIKRVFKRRLDILALQIKSKEEQYKFWNGIVDFRKVRNDNPHAFTQNFVKKCEYIRDITKDLDRTFPEYEKFTTDKGKDGLLKVLVAISNTMSEVGYIQGLNSIAGVFLFYLKEEESFWILVYLMERLKIKDILKSDFEKISLLNYQLECFVDHYLPTLSQYFHDQPITLTTLTTQWFITLYSYSLSLGNIVKVWNFVFIRGIAFLIQFALAIFSLYKNKMLNMSVDEIGPFLKDELKHLDEKEESLFEHALEFRVTKKLMTQLEDHYKNGKPKLLLTFDDKNKGTWHLIPQPQTLKTEANMTLETSTLETKPSNITKPPTPRGTDKNKGKLPMSLSNIVNTIKIDLSDTLKNIFTRKENKPSTAHTQAAETSSINKSSFILEDDKPQDKSISSKHQLNKTDQIDRDKDSASTRNLSILTSEINNSRSNSIFIGVETPSSLGRNEPFPMYETTEATFAEPKSSSPQKPSPSARIKAGNFDFFPKDLMSAGLPGEHKTPIYGRPKIRPTNNSIDVSDFSMFSADKDFIRQLQSNMSTSRYLDSVRSPYLTTNSTLTGLTEDTKRVYHSRMKQSNVEQKFASVNLYQRNEDIRGMSFNRRGNDEQFVRKFVVSPKNSSDFKQKQPVRFEVDLQSLKKVPHNFNYHGDTRKYP